MMSKTEERIEDFGSVCSRRSILKTGIAGITGMRVSEILGHEPYVMAGQLPESLGERKKLHERDLTGIQIIPGMWRPHYPWEHIAWVKPPWLTQDYIWMDFPEAIFTDQGLLFLSHINPPFPQLFPNEPHVPWKYIAGGISFERTLPNKIAFGGSLIKTDVSTVSLQLYIRNGSDKDLTAIKLQTCAFLRASFEFSDFTTHNKFVHLPEHGWLPFDEAIKLKLENGKYHLGFRGLGPRSADLPVMATASRGEFNAKQLPQRIVAFTWETNTISMVSNPAHPCMHADPGFPDIRAGQSAKVSGRLIFFEGSIEEFGKKFSMQKTA
jgi:hypothetical protein